MIIIINCHLNNKQLCDFSHNCPPALRHFREEPRLKPMPSDATRKDPDNPLKAQNKGHSR